MSYPDSVNDQPSVIDSNGDKFWYKNGQRHRDGGPAIEWADGAKEWYKNGKLHRDGGPAIEWANGAKSWYLNGVCCTQDQFLQILQKKASQLTIESSKTNTTNSICYFCGSKTVPLFGRKMICSVCRK